VAAISVTAPVQRMPLENIAETAQRVVESADQISQRLGFAPEIHYQASTDQVIGE
jgi:DNA-binding IclR family transcriptional regulator